MNAVDISDLHKSYGPTRVLDGVSFAIGEAEKVGLVGRNGCGKSTLFRILAGMEAADSGRIVKKRGLALGYLPQKPSFPPDSTIRQVLESHLGELREKLVRYRAVGNALKGAEGQELKRLLAEQDELHAWLDLHGSWDLGPQVEEMCTRFGFGDPEARIGALSGGWNQRVALAGLLLAQPDLLLLDEPTNQLDAETTGWLEEHVGKYAGAVLLVTHDRYFLDRAVARMLELEAGQLTSYSGGYTDYLEKKAERLAHEDRRQTRLLNLLRREEEWLARGAKARTTKQKARIDRVEDLRGQKVRGGRRELALTFGSKDAGLGGTILEAAGLTVEAGGVVLVRGLDLQLRKGDRVGILGSNGCGKTTLVRALLGQIEPSAGTVTVGKNTRIGYLDQGRSGLEGSQRVEEALGEGDWVTAGGPGGEKRHKVGYLEDFLFSREDQQRPISTLSGGERARLLLAKLLLAGSNVLVLDEPTNDLDIPTLQVLDSALADFPGSALVVTHDRYFLDRVATGILHFEGRGRVVLYQGNYEIFSCLRAQSQSERPQTESPSAASPRDERPKRVSPSGLRKLTFRETQELGEVEREVEVLEERKREIEAVLADPSRLQGDRRGLQEIAQEFSALEERLETLLRRWEELEVRR